jgi:PAS domain S-box-containing protein
VTLAALALDGFSSLYIYREARERQTREAVDQANKTLAALQKNVTQLLDYGDKLVCLARTIYLGSGDLDYLRGLLTSMRSVREGGPEISILLADPSGQIIFDSELPDTPDVNLADLEYFRKAQMEPEDKVIIDPTRLGRVRHKPFFRLVRPMRREGRFVGVAIFTYTPDSLRDLYTQFNLGPNSLLAVRTIDPMMVIARQPDIPEAYGKISGQNILQRIQRQAPSGAYKAVSPVDNELRHISYATIPEYGLVVQAGAADRDIVDELATFRNNLIIISGSFAVVILGFGVAVMAITRRNRDLTLSEEALGAAKTKAEDGERILNAIMENIPEGVGIADAKTGDVRYMSRYGNVMIGGAAPNRYGRKEIESGERVLLYHKDTGLPARIEDMPVYRAAMLGQSVVNEEWIFNCADGRRPVILCNSAPIRDAAGQVMAGVVVWHDISGLKQAEEALQASKEFYRAVVNDQAEFVCRFKRDGVFTFANEALCRFHGKRLDELQGRSFFYRLSQADREHVEKILAGLTRQNPVGASEVVLESAAGERRWVQWSNRAIFTAQGEFIEYQAVGRDITERKRLEEELLKAKQAAEAASRSKSEFLANMSHEIRTPLSGVLTMLQLLEAEGLSPQQSEYVSLASQAGQNLLVILNDVLDLSKIEAGYMRIFEEAYSPGELAESVRGLFSVQAAHQGLELVCEVDQALPQALVGDAPRLRQILFNLVGNAVKFTEKGSVRVSLAPDDSGTMLDIVVADTGIGIPEEKQKDIFDPFVQADGSLTREHQGTGLGLAIVKRLAELMGGGVSLDSRPGQGTTTVLRVPLKPGSDILPDRPGSGILKCPLNARVLLVEDDRVNRLAAQGLLRKKGQQVFCASNGREALDFLAANQVDAVLMDVQMAVMDGIEAVRRIRAGEVGRSLSRVPIVALTAHTMKGDEERLLQAGFDAFLSKPLDIGRAMSILAEIIRP